ncbi:MAG: RNA pseudouridine synthase [Myxococcota bacterium]|nr:RNA pseudouridine synthase [Myxococcota bacterium]
MRRVAARDDPDELHRLEQESWDESVAYRKTLKELRAPVNHAKARYDDVLEQMTQLKARRRALSNRLQLSFNQEHNLTNFCGHSLPLEAAHIHPVSLVPGTGECAAPKLLQDAARRGLKPISMAEVWVGDSLADPIRIEGHVYPPCEERCHPILGHMLCGANEPNVFDSAFDLPLLSETDDWIAVDKPGRLLAAPGRGHDKIDSVVTRVRHFYARGASARAAHRLDYETSGLMVIALHAQAQASFHRLFLEGAIEKWYLAWLETAQIPAVGAIELPLSAVEGGGRKQSVSTQGKDAVTDYQVLGEYDNGSLILFRPQTGRTHQLRVHAAHEKGLSNSIRGDELYGQAGDTLFLHAWRLSFPVSGSESKTTIWCPPPEQWPNEMIQLADQTQQKIRNGEMTVFCD